jgi:hypothetical protein
MRAGDQLAVVYLVAETGERPFYKISNSRPRSGIFFAVFFDRPDDSRGCLRRVPLIVVNENHISSINHFKVSVWN